MIPTEIHVSGLNQKVSKNQACVQTVNYPQCLHVPIQPEMALFLISILWALLGSNGVPACFHGNNMCILEGCLMVTTA